MKQLISFLCVLCLCICLAGCGTKGEASVVEDAISSSLNIILVGDANEGTASINPTTPHSTTQTILSKAEYEINEIEIMDNQATATVIVSSPDVIQILRNNVNSLESINDLLGALEDSLAAEYPEKEYTVEVTLQKNGDAWEIIPNEELMNALYGGLIEEGQRVITDILNVLAEVAENG